MIPVAQDAEPVPGFDVETYMLLREFVRVRTGISYGEPRRRIFENRVMTRVRALGLSEPRAYFRYLTFHPERQQEFLKLVSVLTNNETYFFRETPILESIVKRAVSKVQPKFRVLSAGSSSGEELSTLAMLAREQGADLSRWQLQGVDIDVGMVDIASRGVYRNKSFRNTEPEFLVKYFTPEGEHRRFKKSMHDHLNFRWANLVDPATLQFPHAFDVILCRNVLIYFEQETVLNVLRLFHGLLADDGVLAVGVSESLANVPFLFDPVRDDGVILYRKVPMQ